MILSAPIFLLDPELSVLHSMQTLFHGAGYSTRGFVEPQGLFEDIRKGAPAALVANACIPSMHGAHLVKRVLALQPQLPILLLAEQSNIATAVQALKSGARHFIERPVSDRILLEELESILNRTQRLYSVS
jgi:FixJ family two-component response regulator